jgi:hypothetical protein
MKDLHKGRNFKINYRNWFNNTRDSRRLFEIETSEHTDIAGRYLIIILYNSLTRNQDFQDKGMLQFF